MQRGAEIVRLAFWSLALAPFGCGDGSDGSEQVDATTEMAACDKHQSHAECVYVAKDRASEFTACGPVGLSETPERRACMIAAFEDLDQMDVVCLERSFWTYAECASLASCDADAIAGCGAMVTALVQQCKLAPNDELARCGSL